MLEEKLQNISAWLAEIQSLQQQIAELKQERSQAYASADNWRNAYDAEAQQRRRDTQMYQDKISQLERTLTEMQAAKQASDDVSAAELSRLESGQSVEQLRRQLVVARRECEQLKSQLHTEQAEHSNTRESLTAALGDAVDLLAKK